MRTRERWLTSLQWLDGRPAAEPVRSLVHARYLVIKEGAGWRVEAWDFDPRRDEEEPQAT